ncbi:hypothetical protein HYW58_02760 [Candidatus Kaiserbacteria bacterium]|nr:hypothetical protein [Candidatus Kaiserbacteria bacterium]
MKIWIIGRWILLILAVLFVGLVIYRIPFIAEQERTEEAITRIEAQVLTKEDVTGERLPPQPDQALVNATVEGIDANKNGIRDDVELAIFERYSGDINIKIRAAMLQYAIAQQVYLTDVSNSEIWIAAVKHRGRGIGCLVEVAFEEYTDIKDQIGKTDEWIMFVSDLIFNSDRRLEKKNEIDQFDTAYADGGTETCDVDLEIL